MTVLMIDPPWPQKKGGKRSARPNQGRNLDYDTMSVLEIFELLDQKFDLDTAPHTVFLWCIDKFLPAGELAMLERGYRLHARLIWDKCNGIAPAFTVRFSHEYLLWYYKSPMPPIAREAQGKFLTVIREPARQHSRKPDAAYEMVKAFYPEDELIDIFSRENRPGWQTWGHQTGYFQGTKAR